MTKILHIDDDPDDREMLDEVIRQIAPAVEIVSAGDGRAGVNYLKSADNLPCLVILDINMPILDGKKTLEVIRQNPSLEKLPVIVFTSSTSKADAAFFLSCKVEVINKPYSSVGLEQVARRIVEYCSI